MASDAVGRGDASAFWVAGLAAAALRALRACGRACRRWHARLHAGVVSSGAGRRHRPPHRRTLRCRSLAPRCPIPRAMPGLPSSPRRRRNSGRGSSRPPATATRPQFASLGPDSPLRELPALPPHRDPSRARPGPASGQLKNRQADAIGLLQKGRLLDLRDLRELDLSPTADLCQAYGAALSRRGGQGRPRPSRTISASPSISKASLPNIRWLIASRCDLGQPLGLLAGNVRAVAEFLAHDRLRRHAGGASAVTCKPRSCRATSARSGRRCRCRPRGPPSSRRFLRGCSAGPCRSPGRWSARR